MNFSHIPMLIIDKISDSPQRIGILCHLIEIVIFPCLMETEWSISRQPIAVFIGSVYPLIAVCISPFCANEITVAKLRNSTCTISDGYQPTFAVILMLNDIEIC